MFSVESKISVTCSPTAGHVDTTVQVSVRTDNSSFKRFPATADLSVDLKCRQRGSDEGE